VRHGYAMHFKPPRRGPSYYSARRSTRAVNVAASGGRLSAMAAVYMTSDTAMRTITCRLRESQESSKSIGKSLRHLARTTAAAALRRHDGLPEVKGARARVDDAAHDEARRGRRHGLVLAVQQRLREELGGRLEGHAQIGRGVRLDARAVHGVEAASAGYRGL
jgi:hypothetical protein